MQTPNKQDFIFIGSTILFIGLTFLIYLFITQYFIINNCSHNMGLANSSGYRCFGYYTFFDKSSIYFYLLFLWTIIVSYIRKQYLIPNKKLFIGGIILLLVIILYTYMSTPVISLDSYIESLPKIHLNK